MFVAFIMNCSFELRRNGTLCYHAVETTTCHFSGVEKSTYNFVAINMSPRRGARQNKKSGTCEGSPIFNILCKLSLVFNKFKCFRRAALINFNKVNAITVVACVNGKISLGGYFCSAYYLANAVVNSITIRQVVVRHSYGKFTLCWVRIYF